MLWEHFARVVRDCASCAWQEQHGINVTVGLCFDAWTGAYHVSVWCDEEHVGEADTWEDWLFRKQMIREDYACSQQAEVKR